MLNWDTLGIGIPWVWVCAVTCEDGVDGDEIAVTVDCTGDVARAVGVVDGGFQF